MKLRQHFSLWLQRRLVAAIKYATGMDSAQVYRDVVCLQTRVKHLEAELVYVKKQRELEQFRRACS